MPRFFTVTKQFIIFAIVVPVLAVLFSRQSLRRVITSPKIDECSHPPLNSCSFYADCLESRYHCGPMGYPIGYGQKYCLKFQTHFADLSEQGQAWMLATMHCLQLALVPDAIGARNATTTCEALADKAFSTHAGCYVQNGGICKLPPADWEVILGIVGINTLFSSWDALKASLTAGTDCLEFFVRLSREVQSTA